MMEVLKVRFYFVSGVDTSIFYTTGLHCIKKRSRIFDVYFNFCRKNQVASLVLTFVY
jgi:hypothetical protein